MSQPVDVDLNLSGDYVQSVGEATQATQGLATAINALQAPSRSVQSALDAATPSRVHLAAWSGFTAAAAYWQSQTSGIRATSVAAGQSFRSLEGDVQRLARSFPIGTAGAVALVQAVQGLGQQQSRVRPLATEFERLSAATNSFGPEMATSFGQLNREMASLDPGRVTRFGDVLTTLSAKTGASAMGMVSFAHAIAPMAQQAGLGETAVLGISSAFVKLGDDGGAAATAVNKILSDLNRSVREGSNDMAAYAQITGMTVTNFKALYEANPAQALASVTTAIGRAGPRGQMELENLGLEGVRTQRALLQLSQSGGLGAAISQAQGAYGNGSTQKAAEAALGGLNSSLDELRSTAGQTADALGGPFLRVMTRVTDAAKAGLAPVNAALGSGYGQSLIGGVGALAVGGLLARRVVRPLGTGALAFQAATSGPVRSLAGGYALGRTGDLVAADAMRTGRFGREAMGSAALGVPYGRGFMQSLNAGFLRAGSILGQARTDLVGPYAPGAGGGGIGFLGRAGRAGIAASSMAYEGWARTFADPYRQSTLPAGDRQSLLTPERGGLFSQANQVRQQAGIRAALGLIEKEGTGSAAALSRMTSATLGATRAVSTFAGRTVEAGVAAGGAAVKGILGSALGLVGGVGGAALIGGGLAYSAYRGNQQANAAEQDRVGSLDMYSVLNTYRDAMGQAGEASVTLADQMQQAAATIGNSVTTFDQAKVVSAQDISVVGQPNAKRAKHLYAGSDSDIAGQIGALNLNGLTPQDLQGVKMDLLQQGIPADHIDTILRQAASNNAQGGVASASTLSGLVQGVATSSRNYSPSEAEKFKRNPLQFGVGPVHFGLSGESDWRLIGSGGVGSKPLVGDTGKKTLDLLQNSIMQQYADLTGHFSQAYSVQQQVRTANTALQDALKTGDPDTVAAVAQRLGVTLTGNQKFHVSAQAVRDSGGDITKLLGNNKVYGKSVSDWMNQGVTAAGRGVDATRIATGDYTAIQSAGATDLLPYFGNTRPGGAMGKAYGDLALSEAQPANAQLQTTAMNEVVNSATKAGLSLTDLAVEASKATSTTAGWQQQMMAAIAAEAQFRQNVSLQGATRATTLAVKTDADLKNISAGPGVDPNGFQAKQYAQAKQDLADQRGSLISFYQQRVMAQYQYQIQSERAQADYQRSVSRSEQDYLTQRGRANRDFAIQITRMQQDAAKQMYDPYTRIQAKPVWDAANLIGNRSEQIQAMRQQLVNIRTLRGLGLSAAAINQLSLYDPANAQQVQQLVADLQASHSEVAQLNAQASTAQSLGAQLLGQSPDYQRTLADHKRAMSDMAKDHRLQMNRMATDENLAMSRMRQDMHMQDLEITNDMGQLSKDMHKIVNGQFVDLQGQVNSSLQSTLDSAQHYVPLINSAIAGIGTTATGSGSGGGKTASSGLTAAGSTKGGGYGNSPVTSGGKEIYETLPNGQKVDLGTSASTVSYVAPGTGSVYRGAIAGSGAGSYDYDPDATFMRNHPADPNFNRSIAKKMAPHWSGGAEWSAWNWLWNNESGWNQYADNAGSDAYGIPQALPGSKMSTAGRDWRTNPATQIKWGIDYIGHRYGDPVKAAAHERKLGWYAEGSVFTGPSVVGVGERGPEAAIPLNSQGLNFMVSALRQYVGPSEAKMIGGGMAYATHISHDIYTYDQRLDMTGAKIEVKANSPKELQVALDEKTRADNLVATRGVKRG